MFSVMIESHSQIAISSARKCASESSRDENMQIDLNSVQNHLTGGDVLKGWRKSNNVVKYASLILSKNREE